MRDFVITVLVCGGLVGGAIACIPPAEVAASSVCRDHGLWIERTADNCAAAKRSLDRLVAKDPACRALFPEGGAGVVCKAATDAGLGE